MRSFAPRFRRAGLILLSVLLGSFPLRSHATPPSSPDSPTADPETVAAAPGDGNHAGGPPSGDVRRETVVYKRIGPVELIAHIYQRQPVLRGPPRVAVVFFPGGGWLKCDVEQFAPQARYFADLGLVCVVVDYRVKNRHQTTPFEALQDAKSALRWVRAHAREWNVDSARVVAAGGSAGGQLAVACATVPDFDEPGEETAISARPDALVLFNPVLDNSPEGYGAERLRGRWGEFSPLHNLRAGLPPAIVFLGTADRLVPVATAERFQAEMRRLGARCELELYADAPHGFFNYRQPSREYYHDTLAKMHDFLHSLGFVSQRTSAPPDSEESARK